MPPQRLPVLPPALLALLLVVLPQVALLPLVVPPLLVVLPLLVPLVPLLLVLLLLVPPLPVVSVLSQWVALSQGQPLPVWGLLLLALSGGLPVRRLVCSPFLRFTIQKINPGSTAGVFCCPRPRRPTPPNWRTLPPAVAS